MLTFPRFILNLESTETMKITFATMLPGDEEEIIIKCHKLQPEIHELLDKIKSSGNFLMGEIDKALFQLRPADIIYIEAVDGAVFMYDDKKMYESYKKLYELEKDLALHDFIRISKSTIINMRKIRSVIPSQSVKMIVAMDNGEKLECSRHYIDNFKTRLGI